jgi:hypothetical protein
MLDRVAATDFLKSSDGKFFPDTCDDLCRPAVSAGRPRGR